jgi:NAD-dependent SIR2 family protein deacetylase
MTFFSSRATNGGLIFAPANPTAQEQAAQTARLKRTLDAADAVLVGAGAGMSTAAGFDYSGPRFEQNFADFIDTYNIPDMYSGGFYPFPNTETFWAWWSRMIYVNRYAAGVGKPYSDLLKLIAQKDYFVLTTNVDHQFQLAGVNKMRLFYTQGDYGLFQCSRPCTQETYDNEEAIKQMVEQQQNMQIPHELLPTCPHCGAPLTTNLRADNKFVEDAGWHKANNRYANFRQRTQGQRVLFLELGVGANTPGIIKYPFWAAVAANPQATYACINLGEAYAPEAIESQSILINANIADVLSALTDSAQQ